MLMNFLVIKNLVLLFDIIYSTVMILILFIPLFKVCDMYCISCTFICSRLCILSRSSPVRFICLTYRRVLCIVSFCSYFGTSCLWHVCLKHPREGINYFFSLTLICKLHRSWLAGDMPVDSYGAKDLFHF